MKARGTRNSRVQGTATPGGAGGGGVAIRVRGLRKRYGDVEAVRGIDLTMRTGEIFAFLGPNGAGKTTTVETLEGYRHRDAGEVEVLGPTRHTRRRGGGRVLAWSCRNPSRKPSSRSRSASRCTPATTRGPGQWLRRWSWWAWPIGRLPGAAGCRAASAGGWMWPSP
jgi:hypothetical protein